MSTCPLKTAVDTVSARMHKRPFGNVSLSFLFIIVSFLEVLETVNASLVSIGWSRLLQMSDFWPRLLKERTRPIPIALHGGWRGAIFEKANWLFVSRWMTLERRKWISMMCEVLPGQMIKFAIGADWRHCPLELIAKITECREIVLVQQKLYALPDLASAQVVAIDEITFNNHHLYGMETNAAVCLFLDMFVRRTDSLYDLRPALAENIKFVVADRSLGIYDLKLLSATSVVTMWTRIHSPVPMGSFMEALTWKEGAFSSLEQFSFLLWEGDCFKEFEVMAHSLWQTRPRRLHNVFVILHLNEVPEEHCPATKRTPSQTKPITLQ